MATPATYLEEECLNVYWKIKNVTYCCDSIKSPAFLHEGCKFYLFLNPGFVDIECSLECPYLYANRDIEMSFLTCDGSMEESVSGAGEVKLHIPKDIIFGSRRSSFLPEDTFFVRCRMRTDSQREKLFFYSQIGVKRKYFLWTFRYVKSYSGYYEKIVELFSLYGNIVLSLKSMGGINSDEQFEIEIRRTGGERCFCVLKISVLDVDGKSVTEVCGEFIFQKQDEQQVKSFPSIIKKNKWLEYKHLLLSEDKITLKCYLTVTTGKVSDETADVSCCEMAPPLLKESDYLSRAFGKNDDSSHVTELQTDLKILLETATLHDVSLQIGAEVIPAHKSILCARSPVFKAMFTGNMKEGINNTVVIDDFDVETVQSLLRYIYTDSTTDEEWENMKNLFLISDKYQVLSLKEKCVSFLKGNLSISNVCEALLLADLHPDANLKTAVLDFISEYDSAVFVSEEWQELEKNKSSLVIHVLREICCNRKFK